MSRRRVRLAAAVLDEIERRYPHERSPTGRPTFEEFVAGPVHAAMVAFERAWDELPHQAGPSVRAAITVPTPMFPPAVFFGVLLASGEIEIAGFEVDEGYWGLSGVDADR